MLHMRCYWFHSNVTRRLDELLWFYEANLSVGLLGGSWSALLDRRRDFILLNCGIGGLHVARQASIFGRSIDRSPEFASSPQQGGRHRSSSGHPALRTILVCFQTLELFGSTG